MRKILVFFVLFALLLPSGNVNAETLCPTDEGWTCQKATISTIGLMIVVSADFPIQQVWIDGKVYSENTDDGIFYITGIGTSSVSIFSDKVSMKEVGVYAPAPTPVPSKTATTTATPTMTRTPTVTQTSVVIAIQTAVSTPNAITREKPNLPLMGVTIVLLVVALITIVVIVKKRKF